MRRGLVDEDDLRRARAILGGQIAALSSGIRSTAR